jgi:uncharacterized membrane protein HdeD (DUF308 family)
MWNPFAALMRAEDRMFAATRRRRGGRPQHPIRGAIASGTIMLIAGLIVYLFDGFKSARPAVFLAAWFAIWALYLAILRLTVRDRHRR